MEKLYLKTVSRNLLEGKDGLYKSISLFNFENGTQKVNLDDKKSTDTVAAQGTSWIRVHLRDGKYYDFITSSLTLFFINGVVIVMCNDDAEYIDAQYVVKLIKEHQISKKEIQHLSEEDTLEDYYKDITKKTNEIAKEMEDLYSVSKQVSSSRLNIQETYTFGKQRLEIMSMQNIIIKQLTKENKKQILDLI